jgi:Ankyrin repeats (3 copies)
VIQWLLNSSSVNVAFLYLDHQQAQSRRPSEYLASLVHQFAQQKKSVCASVQEAYDSLSPKSQKPDLGLLKRLLLDSVESFGAKTYIVLDAFDECAEDGKKELIETIAKLLGGSEHIYLLITSRPHSSLDSVASLVPTATRTLPVIAGGSSQTKDLKRYLEEKLTKERLKDDERKFIRDGIAEKAKGLYKTLLPFDLTFNRFLLATLHLKSVLAYRNPKDRKKALASLPKEINAAYEGEMARLKRNGEGDFKIAKRALSWIYWAKRSLTMRELQEAIAIVPIEDVETCDEESRDLDPESITDPEFILDCCGSLILWDNRADIVGFSHYTVSEFFDAQPDGNIESEVYVARSCLTYLCFDGLEDAAGHVFKFRIPGVRKYHLLRYICVYGGSHISGSQAEKVLDELVLSVLWSTPRLQGLVQLQGADLDTAERGWELHRWEISFHLEGRGNYLYAMFESTTIFTGWGPLHVLSAWNLTSLLDGIISGPPTEVIGRLNNISQKWSDVFSIRTSVKCDLNDLRLKQSEYAYPTPLHVACFYDNSEVVALLLANCYDLLDLTYGDSRWNALAVAAALGHERCVRVLLERGANQNAGGVGVLNALTRAMLGNHIGVVGMLLENGAAQEARTEAMGIAVYEGHGKLVKLLLEAGEVADCMALSLAAYHGDEGIVQLLLEAGVNPLQDDSANPLRLALAMGHEKIARWLLEAGADANAELSDALVEAKWCGREEIIQLLLDPIRGARSAS